ncbi:MAG: hypothetical protein N3F66_03620 [Spirochaetes bacterium]|nr:hypothetical protein [Spirochaetota bacterium]
MNSNIIPLNKIDNAEQYIVIPRRIKGKIQKVIKPLKKVKGNCYFTCNMPHALINFIYRSVKKLGIQDTKLIFSRGIVRINNRIVHNAVSKVALEWDLGISFIIPLKLRYNTFVTIEINNRDYTVRLMELAILIALMAHAHPSLPRKKHVEEAQKVLALGWKSVLT